MFQHTIGADVFVHLAEMSFLLGLPLAVIVFTQWMGRSPDLVENQITYPISSSLVAAV